MTINRAIEVIDATHPSAYDDALKVSWLSELDERVYQMLLAHEIENMPVWEPYTEDTDRGTELLIPDKHAEIYHQYLEMKTALYDRDYAYYNNAAMIFAGLWQEYEADVNRNNMPKVQNAIFNFKGRR